MDDGSDGDVFFPVLQYTAVPAVQRFSGKNHFRGESSAVAGGRQAEQLSVDVMSRFFFMTEKRTEGDGWKSPRGSAGSDTGASGGKHGRKYVVCRDRSSGNGYGEAGFESGTGAERGQTESKEQGTEEDQKDGTQKMETQKDGMEITEPEQTETGITEPAAGESASTAEPEAPQSVPEETIETGGAPREILYPEADTIQETISPDLLADPQALLNRFFVVDPNTSVLPGEIDGSTLLGKDLTLPENAEGPQILIYHTHSQENLRRFPSGRKSGHGNRPR